MEIPEMIEKPPEPDMSMTEANNPTIEDLLANIRDELRELGDGDGIPNREGLDDSEVAQYDALKDEYISLKNLQNAANALDEDQ